MEISPHRVIEISNFDAYEQIGLQEIVFALIDRLGMEVRTADKCSEELACFFEIVKRGSDE